MNPNMVLLGGAIGNGDEGDDIDADDDEVTTLPTGPRSSSAFPSLCSPPRTSWKPRSPTSVSSEGPRVESDTLSSEQGGVRHPE